MEEERRLAYVAITRAERRLYLTCAGYRTLFGRSSYNNPSRFLNEISNEIIEVTSNKNQGFSYGGFSRSEAPVRPAVKRPNYKSSGGEKMGWKAGDKATHKTWGTGMVVSVKGKEDDLELDIAFPEPVGIKRLLAKFAPIEKA